MAPPSSYDHEPLERVVDAALRFLSYRPRSEAEVRNRLTKRFSPHQVDRAIGHLRERGLLDDAAFARFWKESRERSRPRGASALRWELRRHGVPREVIEETVVGLDEESGAYRAAAAMARKAVPGDYGAFKRSLVGRLRRRGFGVEAIRSAVDRLWRELSDPVDRYAGGHPDAEQSEDVGHQV